MKATVAAFELGCSQLRITRKPEGGPQEARDGPQESRGGAQEASGVVVYNAAAAY